MRLRAEGQHPLSGEGPRGSRWLYHSVCGVGRIGVLGNDPRGVGNARTVDGVCVRAFHVLAGGWVRRQRYGHVLGECFEVWGLAGLVGRFFLETGGGGTSGCG